MGVGGVEGAGAEEEVACVYEGGVEEGDVFCWSGGGGSGGCGCGFEGCFVVGEEGGEKGEGAEGGGVEEEEVDLLGWGWGDGEGERGLEKGKVA